MRSLKYADCTTGAALEGADEVAGDAEGDDTAVADDDATEGAEGATAL